MTIILSVPSTVDAEASRLATAPLVNPIRGSATISAVRPIDLTMLASTGKRKVRSLLPSAPGRPRLAFLAESHPKHVVGSWLGRYIRTSVHFWATNRADRAVSIRETFLRQSTITQLVNFRPALLSSAIVGIY
jgi:hypothetical protein